LSHRVSFGSTLFEVKIIEKEYIEHASCHFADLA
jgi:hypothetical protein